MQLIFGAVFAIMRVVNENDQKMLRYARYEEPLRESFFHNITMANVVALAGWLAVTVVLDEIHLGIWLRLLTTALTLSLSGWAAQRLWFRWADRFDRPFGLAAYGSRMPAIFVFGGIFGVVLWLVLSKPLLDGAGTVFLLLGGTAVALQWPLQWSEFNRLRKICLTNL